MLCVKIIPIEIVRNAVYVQSTCIARPCKKSQSFFFQFEIQTFICCDPEGDTQ